MYQPGLRFKRRLLQVRSNSSARGGAPGMQEFIYSDKGLACIIHEGAAIAVLG
jgi:hypothetical protein